MGERSNGKTYGALKYALEKFIDSGFTKQFAYVRRFDMDTKPAKMSKLWEGHLANMLVIELTQGLWETIKYKSGAFYLAKWDEDLNKYVTMETAIGYVFSLNTWERTKSVSYPDICTIVFDEFLSRAGYIEDEFIAWLNLISTIVRRRTGVTIFMIANTVSRSSLYFREMGLTKIIKKIKQGTIEYHETKAGTKISIEYCADANKASTVSNSYQKDYFGFENPRIGMITGGSWETGLYPHKPMPFDASNVRFTFYIYWEYELIRGRIVQVRDTNGQLTDWLYFDHNPHDDPSKLSHRDLIYTPEHSHLPNYRRKITKPTNRLEDTIAQYFRREKTFYEDNETGENIVSYITWCGNAKFI